MYCISARPGDDVHGSGLAQGEDYSALDIIGISGHRRNQLIASDWKAGKHVCAISSGVDCLCVIGIRFFDNDLCARNCRASGVGHGSAKAGGRELGKHSGTTCHSRNEHEKQENYDQLVSAAIRE